jgi:hypothetical protein
VPEALGDREGDISVPLIAIADDAGGGWPERMRSSLTTLFRKRNADERTADLGVLLLEDLKSLFDELSATRLPSAQIVERLVRTEDRPWSEFRQGRPMTAPQLAAALRPFGVRPGTIRIGNETAKGYYREALTEAWSRYLLQMDTPSPGEGGLEPSQRHTQGNSRLRTQ